MKLDHIQLAMPPKEEARARFFFGDILDMEEEAKPYPLSERGGCWFHKGSAIIHVGVEEPFSPQLKAHPAFVVSDLQSLAAELEKHGYDVLWDDALPERERFYTADPFGNRIEFIRAGDGFQQK